MIIRGMIYNASYSGCEGWSRHLVREIRFTTTAARATAAKRRAEIRVASTAPTYTRRIIKWVN